MSLSDISVRRPVLAIVASLLIVTAGIASILGIPIRELPDVDSAVVTVTTTYVGASPQIVDTDITELIESSVAGVSGVKTISSESRRGRSQTVIEFEVGRNIDEAANDVRDAVGRVRGDLPESVEEPIIVKNDSNADPVMRLAVLSDRHSPQEITDYVERFVIDRLSTLDGVASVDMRGERRYAIRIWIDRRALSARGLTVADIEEAIRRNNVELPAGEITSRERMLDIRLDGRLGTVEGFREIVLTTVDGYPIRLRDVARVEQGVENDEIIVRSNGTPAVGLQVIRQSQANTMEIAEAVRDEIDALQPTLPPGMRVIVGSDDALFISASIREVMTALLISLGLVIAVILLFLRSLRTTLVPAVTIPVALIGCMALIALFGFSINVLTLLALLLAIGLVVDDAIVVLENIKRRIDEGETPLVAAVRGTRQVTFAVLATSATLIAVFIPISFLGGQVGRLFSEFGLVMAASVVISTFVALSLCPMIASRILSGRAPGSGDPGAAADGDSAMARSWIGRLYRACLVRAISAPLVVLTLSGLFVAGSVGIFNELPRELAPLEDRGVAFVPITAPQGATVDYTDEQARIIESALDPYVANGDIATLYSLVGWGSRPYRAFVVMRLAPWEDRTDSQADIVRAVQPAALGLPGARAAVASPAGLGLRGNSTPLRIVVGGADFDQVKGWATDLLEHARLNEGLLNPEIDYEENQPQLDLALDRARADDLDVSANTVATTLQTMFASREITTYVDRGREYPVIAQAQESDRRTPSDLDFVFVRSGGADGTLVPLSAMVSAEETAAAAELRRYNRLPSVTIQAALSPDYTLGQAITYMEEGAARILPATAKLGYAGQSATYKETSGGLGVTFAIALLIVFLVLAAQFESFVHPLVIMLSVPLAIAGALYSLYLADVSLNVYSQIGIILLVGLMAKNGILIVEFANQLRDEGASVRDAVIEASVLRFRPIVMTVISTILGAIPLIVAEGAGAESRIAIGWVVVGGLGSALVLTLFLTPVLYDLLAGLTKPRSHAEKLLEEELSAPRPRPAE
ncbi:efflux RND transporter permease subunit [Marivibrio halodurans]|uniref:Efflux RND transporter permease subunit n=1 Tax=Marivibrio halodurans TaxID=2039722 RepID=A0A8J7V382_9PROT|nr:efflux RND transporter permease subunit [Marivibrio halodurans]MBP5856549.1 efflux RND transporter permease subunit [Marivibrio halodurans]